MAMRRSSQLSSWRFWPSFARSGAESVTQPLYISPHILLRRSESTTRLEFAEMWCSQNESVWFDAARFRVLFGAATEIIEGTAKQTWDAEIALLRSPEGADYDRRLFERFEKMRQK